MLAKRLWDIGNWSGANEATKVATSMALAITTSRVSPMSSTEREGAA